MSIITTLSNANERLGRMVGMVFRRSAYRIYSQPGSSVDYLSKVGDGTGSSTVTAPLRWLAKTFPEAPPALWQNDNGQEEQVYDHDLLRLLTRPNSYYNGTNLWMATVTDWNVDGNAYWLKLRNDTGRVVELWWIPHWLIEPVGDDGVFIDHYKYHPGVEPLRLDKEDVIHFRNGLDPENDRLGHSGLKSVLREVFTDDQAAQFTASLLTNMGVPGIVISPEKGTSLNEGDAAEVKRYVGEKFTGDRRGEALVMTGATQIAQFGFSPEQLVLKDLRRVPEERVTAVLGVPAIVAGLGAGLDRSTFTNMGEARAAAYESGLIPMQRIMSEDIRFQLLNEFEADPFMWRFGFDLTQVRVLQEDLLRLARRCDLMYRGGWMMRSEARRKMGLEVDDERDNVFSVQLNTAVVEAEEGVVPVPVQSPAQLELVQDLGKQLEANGAKSREQIADLKAVMTERLTPEPTPAPVVHVDFHENAFAAPPAPNVTVEPPTVTFNPVPPDPPKLLVLQRDDGTKTTYEVGSTDGGVRTVTRHDEPANKEELTHVD